MKKIISVILLSTFIITSCSKKEEVVIDETVKPKFVKTLTLEEKTFSEDIKLIGKVASSKETSVSPLTSGVIKTINVNVGDKVKSGDILAVIDTQSNLTNVNLNNAQNVYNNTLNIYNSSKEALEKNLETAKLQYENAVNSKNNLYTSTQKQLELAESQLDSVLKQKDNTSKTTTTNVALAQESLTSAKLNLENFNKNYDETIKTLNSKRNSLIDNIKVSIDNSLATMDSSLTFVDSILGITNTNKNLNDSYEIYLSAKNTTLKTQAETLFSSSNSTFESLKSKYNQNLSQQELLNYYKELIALSEEMVLLFDKMNGVLDYSVTSSSLSDTTLTGFKTSGKVYQGQIISLKSTLVGLNNGLNDIDNTISSTKTSLETQKATLEQSIKIAEATLNNTLSSTNTSIDSINSSENTTKIQLESTITSIKASRETADNSVKIAQNQYDSAKANYTSSLAGTKSQLDNASGQKNSLNQQLENAFLKAPFDGIITAKNIEIGGSVSQATPAFIVSNSDGKIIKMDVSSENIKYLQISKEVRISKNGKTSTGAISVLGASSDVNTKMFKVEITFNNTEFNDGVVLGDFVDVYIQKNIGEEKFIIIPFSALIVGTNDNYGVYVVGKDNLVEERKVTIGSSNSLEVIITSGLKIGDKVIMQGALNISVGDKVEEM